MVGQLLNCSALITYPFKEVYRHHKTSESMDLFFLSILDSLQALFS